MSSYTPDYKIIQLNNNSKEYEFNYFKSLLYKPQNSNYLCLNKGIQQLDIKTYSRRFFHNYDQIKNGSVEIYYIVDNNYYDELVEENDFNEELVDMIYGIAIVSLTEDSSIVTMELLCKNENPIINLLNYKPGEEILNLIFTNYENNKIIIIEPLNDRIADYYYNYKKPLIKLYNETGTFLFYGTKDTLNSLSLSDLEYLFISFASISYFKDLFNYNDNTIKELLTHDMEFIKNELRQKQDAELNNSYSDTEKKKLNEAFNYRLDNLNYRNIDEILDASNKSQTAGKKQRNQKTRQITRNKKRNKKRYSRKRIIKKQMYKL